MTSTNGITFRRVLHSEWIKLWSVRSTAITLTVAVAGFFAIGLLSCALDVGGPDVPPVGKAMTGSILAMLLLGVLGALVTAGEYGTGMIRSTLSAVPRRWPVLAAKAVVFAAVTYTVMFAAALVTFGIGQAVIGDGSLSDDGVLRVLLGTCAYETGAGLLGLLLGALTRSTPAALSSYCGITFLLTTVSQLVLSDSLREDVGKFLPAQAGDAMGSAAQQVDLLTPGQGTLVFAAYLALFGGLATWRLMRSDA